MHRPSASTPLVALAAAILILGRAAPVRAQQTRDDSAAVLLETARRLNGEGQRPAAQSLLDYIRRNFAGTPAALSADSLLGGLAVLPEQRGGGRTQLIAWSTLYGAWFGITVPAMLGANSATPYGVGLLLGGPAGFALSKAWADRNAPTSGQAGAMMFGVRWGIWQALGWRAVFEIGDSPSCAGCLDSDPGRSPWTAMVIGAAGGLAAGTMIAHRQPSEGSVAFASHGAYWGTWLGIVGASLADQHDDAALATTLIAGDAGLLLGALAAPRNVTSGRVWATSALGIAGVAAGFGVDLIVQTGDTKTALAIPAATGILALAYGWHATAEMDSSRADAGAPALRFGALAPAPALLLRGLDARGRPVYQAGLRIPLLEASF